MDHDNEKRSHSTGNGNLNPDENKISEMLGELKLVKAPRDFDHRLKARIASSSPGGHGSGGFFHILRYALPLCLFLIIGAAVIWNSSLSVVQSDIPSISESTKPIGQVLPNQDMPADTNHGVTETAGTRMQAASNLIVNSARKAGKLPELNNKKVSGPEGLSIDKALTQAPKTILPRGFSSEPLRPKFVPRGFDNKRQFTESDVLGTLGIEAVFDGGRWKVTSVVNNSPADHAGIRTDDQIEAIDGQTLENKKLFTGGFSIKTIMVVRESKNLTIDLKNR